ncbi:Bug family tripartite tricarboxylate transporter substrate binding protein [Rhodoplanes sp. Z2-YC6860]|uniref:Bug family tripartite tricarboxylate transporter substrate binding protein n=1 Tax=Rhodoplanes sp. Z2-YC6860 TaxID=674703 RepID=UPI00078EE897|nr:tripartite tricarboxylate transporter substrate binding protein [Rhodoplanes sp. Z2-YC6860]AMN41383.1 ABC transporter substrate-binding protein [Rhodoplanes sp. Z2-YC6860]
MTGLLRTALVAAAALAALTSLSQAQGFPEHTVKIVVPTAPGGAIDLAGRLVAEKMQAKWGKPVTVENRPGAAMRLGAEAVQKSPSDGYTILVAHDGTMAINPLVFADLGYDPQKDFVPLGLVASIPEAVMVQVDMPAKSIVELIALAKKEPGRLTHASGGSATLLALELFKAMAGLDIRSIPYRGGAPAVTATITGETSMIIADLATGNAALQSDRIRTLAVTSLERSKKYPDVPTLNEAGVPGYEVNTWMGFFAPAGTPKEVVATIESAIKDAVAMPDVRARFETLGANVRSGTAEEMRQLLAKDVAKWATLVKEKNIKIAP